MFFFKFLMTKIPRRQTLLAGKSNNVLVLREHTIHTALITWTLIWGLNSYAENLHWTRAGWSLIHKLRMWTHDERTSLRMRWISQIVQTHVSRGGTRSVCVDLAVLAYLYLWDAHVNRYLFIVNHFVGNHIFTPKSVPFLLCVLQLCASIVNYIANNETNERTKDQLMAKPIDDGKEEKEVNGVDFFSHCMHALRWVWVVWSGRYKSKSNANLINVDWGIKSDAIQ